MNPLPIRLVLTAEQTAAIRESGFRFMAGSPVSVNVTTGRATVLLFECSKQTADLACGIAVGTHRAIRKTTKQALKQSAETTALINHNSHITNKFGS